MNLGICFILKKKISLWVKVLRINGMDMLKIVMPLSMKAKC